MITSSNSNKELIIRLNENLVDHEVFKRITTLDRLRVFMETHVFAVWDFMSLLKRLQRDLTCLDVPWTPPKDQVAARLINEIVVEEESDESLNGETASHFEIYLTAMEEVKANTTPIRRLIAALEEGFTVSDALALAQTPEHVNRFVESTISVAQNGTLEEVLGSFYYGREHLIPKMFQKLLDEWKLSPEEAPYLIYYLKKHIELDGDEHVFAVEQIIDRVLMKSYAKTQSLIEAGEQAIRKRIALWDGVLNSFENTKVFF